MPRPSDVILHVLGLLAALQSASAQGFCQQALVDRPFPPLRSAAPALQVSLRPLLWQGSFAHALRTDSIFKGLITCEGECFLLVHEWYVDTDGLGDDIKRQIAHDSAQRWSVALALADEFRGADAGGTEGMAFVAASLYRDWALPPEPAAAFLADPAFSPRARSKAVRALEPSWQHAAFRRASAAALCSLAARVEGIATMRGDSVANVLHLLHGDEFELLEDIARALGETHESGRDPADVMDLLPPDIRFTRWLRGYLANPHAGFP